MPSSQSNIERKQGDKHDEKDLVEMTKKRPNEFPQAENAKLAKLSDENMQSLKLKLTSALEPTIECNNAKLSPSNAEWLKLLDRLKLTGQKRIVEHPLIPTDSKKPSNTVNTMALGHAPFTSLRHLGETKLPKILEKTVPVASKRFIPSTLALTSKKSTDVKIPDMVTFAQKRIHSLAQSLLSKGLKQPSNERVWRRLCQADPNSSSYIIAKRSQRLPGTVEAVFGDKNRGTGQKCFFEDVVISQEGYGDGCVDLVLQNKDAKRIGSRLDALTKEYGLCATHVLHLDHVESTLMSFKSCREIPFATAYHIPVNPGFDGTFKYRVETNAIAQNLVDCNCVGVTQLDDYVILLVPGVDRFVQAVFGPNVLAVAEFYVCFLWWRGRPLLPSYHFRDALVKNDVIEKPMRSSSQFIEPKSFSYSVIDSPRQPLVMDSSMKLLVLDPSMKPLVIDLPKNPLVVNLPKKPLVFASPKKPLMINSSMKSLSKFNLVTMSDTIPKPHNILHDSLFTHMFGSDVNMSLLNDVGRAVLLEKYLDSLCVRMFPLGSVNFSIKTAKVYDYKELETRHLERALKLSGSRLLDDLEKVDTVFIYSEKYRFITPEFRHSNLKAITFGQFLPNGSPFQEIFPNGAMITFAHETLLDNDTFFKTWPVVQILLEKLKQSKIANFDCYIHPSTLTLISDKMKRSDHAKRIFTLLGSIIKSGWMRVIRPTHLNVSESKYLTDHLVPLYMYDYRHFIYVHKSSVWIHPAEVMSSDSLISYLTKQLEILSK